MRRLLPALLLLAAPSSAADWLLEAERAAAAAPIPGEAAPPPVPKGWVPYEPASRLFRADLPAAGWRAHEEEDALGTIVRVLGPESADGTARAELTVRLVDRDSAAFQPAKEAVEAMRREGPDRSSTPVRPLRTDAGLARIFEIVETRRLPLDEAPSVPVVLHHDVAVVPRGEAYFLVRLVSVRAEYLKHREVFMGFLRALKPIGVR